MHPEGVIITLFIHPVQMNDAEERLLCALQILVSVAQVSVSLFWHSSKSIEFICAGNILLEALLPDDIKHKKRLAHN